MPDILIRCPKTRKPISTGMELPASVFDIGEFEDNKVGGCPECGGTHTWSKADAWVDGQEPKPAPTG